MQDLQFTAKIATHLLNIGFGPDYYFIFAFEHAADCEEWSTKLTERYMLVVTIHKSPNVSPISCPCRKTFNLKPSAAHELLRTHS